MKSAGSPAPGPLAGLSSASGTVKAPSEFKAAKVYFKNVDKNVVYMVFTEGGRYQAVGDAAADRRAAVTAFCWAEVASSVLRNPTMPSSTSCDAFSTLFW